MQALRERDERNRLAGMLQMDDAYLGARTPAGSVGGVRRTRRQSW